MYRKLTHYQSDYPLPYTIEGHKNISYHGVDIEHKAIPNRNIYGVLVRCGPALMHRQKHTRCIVHMHNITIIKALW